MTSTADRYLTFLGTPYITDDGSRAQPAKGRFIEHLRAIHAEQKPKFDLTACLAGKQDGFSGQVYFWSDLHLGHQNIIKYSERPFETAADMGEAMLANCLECVTESDILVFGGDIAMSNLAGANAFLRAIPAYKINILGNHDTNKDRLVKLDVDETVACLEFVCEGQSVFASHYPVSDEILEPGQLNLHGHIHNNGLPPALGNGDRHINMSVELTDYKPVLISQLIHRHLHMESFRNWARLGGMAPDIELVPRRREVPELSPEQIKLYSGITAANGFTLEAAAAMYRNKRLAVADSFANEYSDFIGAYNTTMKAEGLPFAHASPAEPVKEHIVSSASPEPQNNIVYRLKKRAEIRRQIQGRKSVEEGKPDRMADLLDEAAMEIEGLRAIVNGLTKSAQKRSGF